MKNIIVFVSLFFLSSCTKEENKQKYNCLADDLSFWGHYTNTSNLKLDGFYLYFPDSINNPDWKNIIILFENGIVYTIGCGNASINEITNDFGGIENNRNNDAVWGY